MVSIFPFGAHIKWPSRELRTSVVPSRNNLNIFYPSEMLPGITSNLAYLTNIAALKRRQCNPYIAKVSLKAYN